MTFKDKPFPKESSVELSSKDFKSVMLLLVLILSSSYELYSPVLVFASS